MDICMDGLWMGPFFFIFWCVAGRECRTIHAHPSVNPLCNSDVAKSVMFPGRSEDLSSRPIRRF